MVIYEKKIWGDKQRRRERLEAHSRQEKTVDFGYQKVPEAEKTKHVLRHFTSVARYYDFMNTLLSFGIHHLWKRSAVKWMNLGTGDQVIDVCGGTGDLAILAARTIGSIGQVTLYDINRAMLNAAQYKIMGSIHNGRIFYVQGDAEEIASPDYSFDAAMVGFGRRSILLYIASYLWVMR